MPDNKKYELEELIDYMNFAPDWSDSDYEIAAEEFVNDDRFKAVMSLVENEQDLSKLYEYSTIFWNASEFSKEYEMMLNEKLNSFSLDDYIAAYLTVFRFIKNAKIKLTMKR